MQIVIFKSNKNKSSSYKIDGYIFILLLGLTIGLISILSSSASYIYGYKEGYKELQESIG